MSQVTVPAPLGFQTGASSLSGAAKILVQSGVLEEKKALDIQARAIQDKATFLEILGKDNKAMSLKAAEQLARSFELPLVDILGLDRDQFPSGALDDPKKMGELRAVPVFVRGTKMFIAVSDPSNVKGLDFYTHKANKRSELLVVEDTQITQLMQALTHEAEELSNTGGMDDFEIGLDGIPAIGENPEMEDLGDENNPIIKMVSKLLLRAIKQGASDIHFEPYEKFYRIRFRIDGVLKEVMRPPTQYSPYIASRIKVLSQLNIAEKRVPQDGRMKLKIPGGRAIDFRVSTLPAMYGEKIVMRILDPSAAQLGIDALGYEPEEKARLLDAIKRPYGMILVTGPTGSGKTVSLYSCLNLLNNDEINISTAEDPCEIQMGGINQVNVNPAQGLTFAGALKSFLRQDPDVIMVGEIRDEETAEISVKAAQTGHLVLATLHTNDAPKTVSRLIEIGVKPYNVAGAVILITAQRLARKLCPHCKLPDEPTADRLRQVGMLDKDIANYGTEWKAYRANSSGCEHCTSGYKGRVGIYQVMPISETMQKIIMDGGDSIKISEQAKAEDVRDLRQSALLKFRQGLTSLDEVTATTNE